MVGGKGMEIDVENSLLLGLCKGHCLEPPKSIFYLLKGASEPLNP